MATNNATPSPVKPRHTLRRIILVIVGALAVAFIAIQLIPVNRTNPPVAVVLLRRACVVADLLRRGAGTQPLESVHVGHGGKCAAQSH